MMIIFAISRRLSVTSRYITDITVTFCGGSITPYNRIEHSDRIHHISDGQQ